MESICHQMQIEAYETSTCFTGYCTLLTHRSSSTFSCLHPLYLLWTTCLCCSEIFCPMLFLSRFLILCTLFSLFLLCQQCFSSQWWGAWWTLLCLHQANTYWSVVCILFLKNLYHLNILYPSMYIFIFYWGDTELKFPGLNMIFKISELFSELMGQCSK